MSTTTCQPKLTARQRQILDFIRAYIGEHRRPPTVREIGAWFGLRNHHSVIGHLNALEKKGCIKERGRYVSRDIRLAGDPCPRCGGTGVTP
jgi:repressor LexA